MGEQPRMMVMVDAAKIDALAAKLEALEAKIDGATIKPRDEWETVKDHAARVKKQPQTVRKWVREGRIDSKRVGNVTYVRG